MARQPLTRVSHGTACSNVTHGATTEQIERGEQFAIFDELPANIRKWLTSKSIVNLCCSDVRELLRTCWTAEEAEAQLDNWQRQKIEREAVTIWNHQGATV